MINTIVFADTFDKAVAKYDGRLKQRIFDFMVKFRKDPDADGINLKPPVQARDPRVRTARVTQDYRAVLFYPGSGAVYFLLTVLPHDDAYRFAEHARIDVNKVTGGLEVLQLDQIEAYQDEYRTKAADSGFAKALFAGYSDTDLTSLSISPDILPLVRMLTTEDELLGLIDKIPQVQADVLFTLYNGETAEAVYAEVVAPYLDGRPVDVDDLQAALERPATLVSFTVTTSDADVQAALEWPMDRWRTYLHPTQRALAYPARPFNGPFRVTGGPGTGKTVVAVHRAKALVAQADPEARVLMAAFNRHIAATLEQLLRRLGGSELAQRVEVKTVDQLSMGVVTRAEKARPNVLLGNDALTEWESYLAELRHQGADPRYSSRFLDAEWNQVVLAYDLRGREQYLAASRPGRGARRLSAAQREEIWTLISGFEARLRGQGRRTFQQIATDAARYAEAASRPEYRHIVVDEAQDLHASHWRLLRALAPREANDLFICGDPFQRIYQNRVVLGQCGVRIQGRSKRLTINYRTTRQILESSLLLMRDRQSDDLDGGNSDLHGYRSLLRGGEPELAGYPDVIAELDALCATVRNWHDSGIELDDIAVGARNRALVAAVQAALAEAGIPAAIASGNAKAKDDVDEPAVHVTTFHGLKGTEFRCVALTSLGAEQIPPPREFAQVEADPSATADLLGTERSLLFVAGTRAREALAVSWHGEHSPLIAPLINQGVRVQPHSA